MLTKLWKANQQTMPAARRVPNGSSAQRDPQAAPQHDAEQGEQPRRRREGPSSSPATVKMKSVCCSGTKRPAVCVPSNRPSPRARRSRWRCAPGWCCSRRRAGRRSGWRRRRTGRPGSRRARRAARSRSRQHAGEDQAERSSAWRTRHGEHPSRMKTKTIMVPRSGCSMISAIGTRRAAAPADVAVARAALAVAGSASSIAMRTTRATLANSDGCTWKPPPRTIQECAPLIVAPSGESTATRPRGSQVDDRGVGVQQR